MNPVQLAWPQLKEQQMSDLIAFALEPNVLLFVSTIPQAHTIRHILPW